MKDLIRIVIQPHEIPFPFQHGIIVDHKCIQRTQICNADVSVLIDIIHFIALAEDAADFGQLGVIVVLVVVLVQEFNILRNCFVPIVDLHFDGISNEKTIHRIHDVFRKVDHDPIVWLPFRL